MARWSREIAAMNCVEPISYLLDGQWIEASVTAKRWIIGDDGNGNIVHGDAYYQ